MLSRNKLLNGVSFLPFELVEVPELGGSVGIQGLSAKAALDNADEMQDGVRASRAILRLCLVDAESREPLFQDDGDLDTFLSKIPQGVLARLVTIANRLSTGSAEGNLQATSEGGSSSGSRSRSVKRSKS